MDNLCDFDLSSFVSRLIPRRPNSTTNQKSQNVIVQSFRSLLAYNVPPQRLSSSPADDWRYSMK